MLTLRRNLLLVWPVLVVLAGIPAYGGTVGVFFGNTPFGQQELILNGSTTLQATSTGWWDSTGGHFASNSNYGVGDGNTTPDHHDFFVFDLSNVLGPITSAQLSIGNPSNGFGDGSPAGTSSLSIWDVSTPISTLIADGSGQIGIFNDLGSGTLFASRTVSAADDGTQVLISLNSSGLAALSAAEGGKFAVGGSLSVSSAPEPGSLVLLASGLAGFLALARRRCRLISNR